MNLLEPYTYFFELPLYTKVGFDIKNDEDKIFELICGEEGINAYNPTLKENTTFFISLPHFRTYNLIDYNGLITSKLICSRTKDIVHIISYLDCEKGFIQKVGQYPSIAHFHISKIKDYRKLLGSEKIKEFTRAIGLAANGVGIGSFVYLRRLFENLLEQKHIKAKENSDWNDELYLKSKVSERIEQLKDYLPTFLVENKSLYGILSKGIHSLGEDECLQYFEIVKDGIELILDEELDRYNREQKVNEAKKKIGIITQQIKGQNK